MAYCMRYSIMAFLNKGNPPYEKYEVMNMYQKLNSISFYSSFLCLFVYSYFFYACIKYGLVITTFSSILLPFVIVILFILGLLGFIYKYTLWSRVKNWLTIVFTFLLFILLLLIHLASFIGGKEHIQTVNSVYDAYTIHLYSWDAGAAGTFGIVGEIDGLLFDKRFYYETRTDEAEIEWINIHTISINNHKVDLNKTETYYK